MRDVARVLSLTAALLVVGCGSDDQSFNYGNFFPGGSPGTVAPTAVADSFSVLGGGILTGSVTANDTLNGSIVSTFQNPSTSGGTVAITPGGQLTYTPPAGQANLSDTFTYTISNLGGSSKATVTVTVGARGFFVKNDVAVTGSGSQTSPFKTLLEATNAATGTPGAQIVVFRGDGTSTGQNVPVSLVANQAIVAQDPANQPTISGTITLAGNCTLANLRLIGNTGSNAVVGTGIIGATLANVTVANTTGCGVNMTNPSGVVGMTGLTMANIGLHALPLSTNANGLNLTVSGLQVNNTTANVSLAEITGASVVNASFTDVICTNVGTAFPFNIGFDWNARNTSNCTLRVSNYRMDSGGSGMFFASRDSSNTAVVLTNGNITNCSDLAVFLSALNSSSLKTRMTNSRLLNNLHGYRAEAGGTSALCARLLGNNSDRYDFSGFSTLPLLVENLPGVSTENQGTTQTSGTDNNATIDSCGIPQ